LVYFWDLNILRDFCSKTVPGVPLFTALKRWNTIPGVYAELKKEPREYVRRLLDQ
jgi:hypothetical protein